MIEAQGCDALRFTLATGTAAGQDLNLNMDRLASNRNFTNKIWNAGKFVLYAMEGLTDDERKELVAGRGDRSNSTDPKALAALPAPEAWIISRLRAETSTTSLPRTTATTSAKPVARRTASSTTTSRTGSSSPPRADSTAKTPRRSALPWP